MFSSTSQDSSASFFYLAVCSIVTFFVIGFIDSYGVLMVYLVRHYDESNGKAAWVGSLSIFCTFGLFPITLSLCNRFGSRIALLLASILLACVCLISPLATSINYFYLTFSVPLGVASSIVECTVLTTIFNWFNKFRGLAFGLRIGAGTLGTMMYAFILPKFMDDLGWTSTFWALSTISVTCLFFACVHETRIDDTRPTPFDKSRSVTAAHNKHHTFRVLLKDKSFLIILAALTIYNCAVLMPPTFLVQYASNQGIPISEAKYLMVVRAIVSVITRFTSGFFGDVAFKRSKVGRIVLVNMVLFCVSTILCSLKTSFTLLMLYMGVVSILESVHWTMLPLFALEVAGSVNADRAFAIMSCIGAFALLIGLPVLGVLYDKTGDFNVVLYTTSVVFAIASLLLGVGLSTVAVPRIRENLTLTPSQDSLSIQRVLAHVDKVAFYNEQYITAV